MFHNLSNLCQWDFTHNTSTIMMNTEDYLDSKLLVSETRKNDLRHQIWKDLLRLGHSVPCLEKHRNHSINNTYCCFSGSVRSVWPMASSSVFISSPFLRLCSQPKSDSIGPNHASKRRSCFPLAMQFPCPYCNKQICWNPAEFIPNHWRCILMHFK